MNLNGKPTNPGELRTPISLYKRAVSTETGGFSKGAAGDLIADVYAKWTNAFGADVWAAETIHAIAPATVFIRYRSDVDATCLVKKGSYYYEIIGSPDNIQERSEYMEFKVRRINVG